MVQKLELTCPQKEGRSVKNLCLELRAGQNEVQRPNGRFYLLSLPLLAGQTVSLTNLQCKIRKLDKATPCTDTDALVNDKANID